MQIERPWTPTAYACEFAHQSLRQCGQSELNRAQQDSPRASRRSSGHLTNHKLSIASPPQTHQPQNQYYARSAHVPIAAPFDDGARQDAPTREASLGVWSQGSKRVRPNTYDPSLPNQVAFAQQQQQLQEPSHYAQLSQQPHLALPFSDPSGAFAYNPALPVTFNGYPEHAPVAGLSQAASGGDQYITQALTYDSRTPSIPGSERGGNGHSGITTPSGQRPDMSYGPNEGYTHSQQPPEQAQGYNRHRPQSLAEQGHSSQHTATQLIAAGAPGYAATADMSDPHYSYVQPNWNNPTAGFENSSLYGKDVSLHLKLQSLSILDNLSTQIILSLAKPSLSEIEKLTNGEENEESQAYITRKDLFDQTRKVYSRDVPFIDAIAIQLFTPPQQDIIRKANKATFISSILQSHDVSFWDLNEYFLEIFVPSGQRLLKWQGGILLELKTQVYISALLNSDGSVLPILDELFPYDLEDRITARHPDAPNLAPSEVDFVERARARKQYLQAEPTSTALTVLPRKYEWQDFLKEFLSCISKNVEVLLNVPNRAQPLGITQSQIDATKRGGPLSRVVGVESRLLAGLGIVDSDTTMSSGSYGNFGALVPDHRDEDPKYSAASNTSETPNQTTATKGPKSSTSAPRQPWRSEEEDALMAGLEAVKGPHWSQILSLYGRGGSISEILKDRNQIQLKDKARNLKLYYLKMGEEVPACLQGVTGELRKRGGARVRAAMGLDGPEDNAVSTQGVKRKAGAEDTAAHIDPSLNR